MPLEVYKITRKLVYRQIIHVVHGTPCTPNCTACECVCVRACVRACVLDSLHVLQIAVVAIDMSIFKQESRFVGDENRHKTVLLRLRLRLDECHNSLAAV